MVRRGNLFINPVLAATQRDIYDPSGLSGFIRLITGGDGYFIVWSQYKAISNEIVEQWGELDMNSTMSLLRDVYLGKTDFVFNVMQKIGVYISAHQWVACPASGNMAIAFADDDALAPSNPINYFNLSIFLCMG